MADTERVLIRFRDKTTGKLQFEIIEGTQAEIEATLLSYLSDKDAHSLMVLGYSGNGTIDTDGGAQVTIDQSYHEVHAGDAYTVSDYDADIDIAGPKYWRITTGAKTFHFEAAISGIAGCLVELYENPTITDAGTALAVNNNNRASTNIATITAFKDTTVSSDGTFLEIALFGVGGNPSRIAGGTARTGFEWELKPNEDYVIKVTSLADDNKVGITIQGYEIAE